VASVVFVWRPIWLVIKRVATIAAAVNNPAKMISSRFLWGLKPRQVQILRCQGSLDFLRILYITIL
jgi:hypothetical protein